MNEPIQFPDAIAKRMLSPQLSDFERRMICELARLSALCDGQKQIIDSMTGQIAKCLAEHGDSKANGKIVTDPVEIAAAARAIKS